MSQPKPDYKDWTWVLDSPCPECGFDSHTFDRHSLAKQVRANAGNWRKVLGKGEIIHVRPPVPAGDDEKWSALEYGAHVNDVYELFGERFVRILKQDDPEFPNWDQNLAAAEGRYASADPAKIAYSLAAAAGKVADMLDRVREEQWDRTGRRSDGASFTLQGLATYQLHDAMHHLWDVEQGFEAIRKQRQQSNG